MLTVALRNTQKAPMAVLSRHSSGGAQAEVLAKIGNRDVVGYGWNGEPCYQDRVDYPMPAIRFRENTSDVLVRLGRSQIYKIFIFNIFLGSPRKREAMLEEIVCD